MNDPKHDIRIFDRDTVKYAAAIMMAAGHITGNFPFILRFIHDPALRQHVLITVISLAVFAPPIFFSFIEEGYIHTRSRKKYAFRLFVFALICQVPFCLMKRRTLLTPALYRSWNIAATLFLGLVCLFIWDSRLKLLQKILLVILVDIFTVIIRSEWTIFGIPMILGFHIFRERPKIRTVWFSAIVLIQQFVFLAYDKFDLRVLITKGYLAQTIALLAGYFAATAFYNGKKGKHPVFSKWFFYAFYPGHMLLIFFFRRMLYAG